MNPRRWLPRFTLYFLPLALLVLGLAVFLVRTEQKQWLFLHGVREIQAVQQAVEDLAGRAHLVKSDLEFAHRMLLRELEKHHDGVVATGHVQHDWELFSASRRIYDQIRWLDERGHERIRVDYAQDRARIIPAEELQDKSGRYYFIDAMLIKKGQMYVSPLDLNVEHSRIEHPLKSVLRLALPLDDSSGKRRGLVILNYLGKDLLSGFQIHAKAASGSLMMFNDQGYWLSAPVAADEWGFMLDHGASLSMRHPTAWQRMHSAAGQFQDTSGLWTFQRISPFSKARSQPGDSHFIEPNSISDHEWVVASLLPDATIQAANRKFWLGGLPIFSIALALLAVLIYWLTRVQALAQAERECRDAALQALPLNIFLSDAHGILRWVNQRAADICRCTPEKLAGNRLDQVVPEPVRSLAALRQVDQASSGEIEVMIDHDGNSRHYRVNSCQIVDPSTHQPLFMTYSLDITRRVNAIQATQRQEVWLRAILDNVSDGLLAVDASSRIEMANAALERMFGYRHGDLLGTSLRRLIPPDVRSRHAEHVTKFLAECEAGKLPIVPANRVFTGVRSDGSLLQVEIATSTVYNEQRLLVLASVRDVSQRLAAEAKEREWQIFLHASLDALTANIAIIGQDGIIRFVNQRWRDFARENGYQGDIYHLGEPYIDLIQCDPDSAHLAESLRGVLRGEQPTLVHVYPCHSPEEARWFRMTAVGFMQNDSRHMLIAHENITELMLAQAELEQHRNHLVELVHQQTIDLLRAKEAAEQANHAKSDFIANITHEFRTPITSILGFAEWGMEPSDELSQERVAHLFNRIKGNANRLLQMVNDLLDLAKLDAGRFYFSFHAADLTQCLDNVLQELTPLRLSRQIDIQVEVSNRPVKFIFDAARISQVFRNLLANAYQFSPPGGVINIAIAPLDNGAGWRIDIQDHGIGIPEYELELVFDKFTQSSRTRTGAGGTGLGLAICRELVEAHGGTIRATRTPGGGATLTFTLPMTPPVYAVSPVTHTT